MTHLHTRTAIMTAILGMSLVVCGSDTEAQEERDFKVARVVTNDSKSLQVKMKGVRSVALSPDGKILATGGSMPSSREDGLSEGIIKLWNLETGREEATLWQSGRREGASGHSDTANSVNSIVFSPDGKILVAGDRLGFRAWEVDTGKERFSIDSGSSKSGPAFSPDGKTIAVPAIHTSTRMGVITIRLLVIGFYGVAAGTTML